MTDNNGWAGAGARGRINSWAAGGVRGRGATGTAGEAGRLAQAWAAGPVAEPLEGRRLLSAGDLDPSFGAGGVLTLAPPGVDRGASYSAYHVVPVAGGKTLVVGQVRRPADEQSGSSGRVYVARVDAAGRFDPTYGGGGDGFAEIPGPLEASDGAYDAVAQPDGKLLLLLYGGRLVRLTAAGRPDPAFGGGDGVADVDGYSMALAPDGKIVVGSAVGGDEPTATRMRVERLLPNGSPDKSFGRGGVFTGFRGYAEGLTVADDGKVVLVGNVPDAFPDRSEDDDAVGVGRLRADGTPDPAFGGGDGFALVDVGIESDGAESVAVDAKGRLVVGAYQLDSDTFYPFRLRADGAVDTFFTPIDFGGGVQVRQTVVRPDGTVLFAGYGADDSSDDSAVFRGTFVARYTPDGKLDPAFGGGLGYAPLDGSDRVGLLPDGRFLTVAASSTTGYDPYDLIEVRRYLGTGSGGGDPSGAKLSVDGTLTVTGTAKADRITVQELPGTWRGDVVAVRAGGLLRVFARAAVHRIVVRAGAGDDVVSAYAFGVPVKAYGEAGDDDLGTAAGPAELDGGTGDDFVHAPYSGFDEPYPNDPRPAGVTLRGGDGDDRLQGGYGADLLFGGPGADVLEAGAGDDRLDGGTGPDHFSGGAGVDVLDYGSRTVGVRVDLTDINDDNGAPGEHDHVLGDLEVVIGSAGDDRLRGNAADNVIYGNAGNDFIEGLAGNDLLSGGPGRDRIYGGLGDDQLYAGGDDRAADLLDGGPGRDRGRRGPGDDVLHIETFI